MDKRTSWSYQYDQSARVVFEIVVIGCIIFLVGLSDLYHLGLIAFFVTLGAVVGIPSRVWFYRWRESKNRSVEKPV